MGYLKIVGGTDTGKIFEMTGDVITIGRHSDNNVVLLDPSVSRFHAKIIFRDKHYYIQDLRSSQGTFVNDVRVNQEMLFEENDALTIGGDRLILTKEITDKDKKIFQEETDNKIIPAMSSGLQFEDKESPIAMTMLITDKSGKHLTDKHWEILSRIVDATLSVFNLEELLNKLMDLLFEVFKPDRGTILLYDKSNIELIPKIRRPEKGELKISQTIIKHSIENKMSLLIADTHDDSRFKEAQSILLQSISSAICSPLIRKDKVLGVIYIDAQSRRLLYQKEDLALLNIIAANAAISIENAMLITEKVNSERVAAVGVAVSGISHFVKNLILGVTGSESLIDMGIESNNLEIIKNIWPVQKRSVKRISDLVNDMLSYSKTREPKWEKGNLNSLVNEIYESQLQRATDANVPLVAELCKNLTDSEFDHKAMQDTILNIVGNAIEACSEHPGSNVIIKTLQPDDKQVAVWIMDTGPGIPPEIQQRIFEPFFSTKGSKGTGLGLAVAKKTIEEHHGKLILESEIGKGTAFKITLPVKDPNKTL